MSENTSRTTDRTSVPYDFSPTQEWNPNDANNDASAFAFNARAQTDVHSIQDYAQTTVYESAAYLYAGPGKNHGSMALDSGQETTLYWNTANITAGTCTLGGTPVADANTGTGQNTGALTQDTDYTLTCGSPAAAGSVSDTLHIQVLSAKAPTIQSFSATRVPLGEPAALSWKVFGMDDNMSCTLAPPGKVDGDEPICSGNACSSGSAVTDPINQATVFTLKCGDKTAGYAAAQATATFVPVFKEI